MPTLPTDGAPEAWRCLRIAYLGSDIDLARDLTRWLIARCDDGTATKLARPPLPGEPAAPAARRQGFLFDEILITIDPEPGMAGLASMAALVAEAAWNKTPYPGTLHLAQAGQHALLGVDLVVDVRAEPAPERRRQDLAFEMPFLCPGAALVTHDAGTSLAAELDELLNRIANGSNSSANG